MLRLNRPSYRGTGHVMICLKLFGGATLEDENGALGGPAAQRRRLALLALLAATHPRPLPREKLLAWLWPDRGGEAARNLLNQAVHAVRKTLGEETLLAAGDELRFDPTGLRCDVVDFGRALAAGDLATAVGLYTGPFLDGFFLNDAPAFAHWAEDARTRYRTDYGRALEQLAERTATAGRLTDAAELWRRRAAEDPYNGRVTIRLMEALEAAGDRAGALRHARVHTRLLEQEFAAEPDPAIAELTDRLRRQPQLAAQPTGTAVPAEESSAGPSVPGELSASGAVPVSAPRAASAACCPPLPGPLGEGTDSDADTPAACAPQPATAPHRRRASWTRVAVPTAMAFGFVAAISTGWLLPQTGRTAAPAAAAMERPKSVVVLPCANLSGDPAEEFFSDGLTEELIGVLSQVRALQVVARTSAFAFKGVNRDVREIGEALGVRAVVECSVRRAGGRVRVTAQLIDAGDGFHLWAESYDREGTDVFAIQAELAARIAEALEAELTPEDRGRLARRPTDDLEAYTLYLKGRFAWSQRGAGLTTAIDYFERAIEVDPQYALAYAGLASAYGPLGILSHVPPAEGRARMHQAALRAIELDDQLAEAHTALAAYLHVYAWDWAGAERAYRRAIELDPDFPTAHDWYGFFLDRMGRFDEAIVARRRAIELDPLTPNSGLAAALRLSGRFDEAEAAYREVLDRHPHYWQAYEGLGVMLETAGDYERALRALRNAEARAVRTSRPKAGIARVLARSGRRDEARRLVDELRAAAEQEGIYSPTIASALAALDDLDGAMAWLEAAYDQRHPDLVSLRVEPQFAVLRGDPRFRDLLRRVGYRD